jgi:hypothetical protein
MMTSRHALFLAGVLATQASFSGVLTAAERPAAAAVTVPNRRWAEFEAGISKAGPAGSREQAIRAISSMFMPAAAKVCEKVDEANVRRQLLLQAIKAKR